MLFTFPLLGLCQSVKEDKVAKPTISAAMIKFWDSAVFDNGNFVTGYIGDVKKELGSDKFKIFLKNTGCGEDYIGYKCGPNGCYKDVYTTGFICNTSTCVPVPNGSSNLKDVLNVLTLPEKNVFYNSLILKEGKIINANVSVISKKLKNDKLDLVSKKLSGKTYAEMKKNVDRNGLFKLANK